MILNCTGVLLCVLHVVSAVVWAVLAPSSLLLDRLVVMVLQEVLAFLLLICLVLLSKVRLQRRLHVNTSEDSNQDIEHVSQIFLVFVSGLLSVGEGGLTDCDRRISCESVVVSPEFSAVLPLFLLTLMMVVQLRHYTDTHIGFFTRPESSTEDSAVYRGLCTIPTGEGAGAREEADSQDHRGNVHSQYLPSSYVSLLVVPIWSLEFLKISFNVSNVRSLVCKKRDQ